MEHGQRIARLQAALDKVAGMVVHDLDYAPIFERLDAELLAAENPTPTQRARALITRARFAA